MTNQDECHGNAEDGDDDDDDDGESYIDSNDIDYDRNGD